MMPAFSVAIWAIVSPRNWAWSMATGAITATSPSATLVASHAPPMPTSMIATSIGASAKAANASTVNTSKKLRRGPPLSCERVSTREMMGATSSHRATNASWLMGSPSIWIRSRTVVRCGDVNSPVRRPCARTSDSAMRAVDVLPLVPVMWMTRNAFCGSPSSAHTSRTRPILGSKSCSGLRATMLA